MDVGGIPVEVRDGPIILPCIQHDKIEEGTKGEGAPDAEVVVHFDLPDGHPFEISTHSVHLALINSHTAVHHEGGLGVVELRGAIAIGVVGYLVVVPYGNPRKVLMTEEKVEVCSVGGEALSIVVEGEDCPVWQRDPPDALTPTVVAVLILVDIVAQVYHVVHRIFAHRIAKGIEEAKGEIAARIDGKANLSAIVCSSRRGLSATHRTADIG